MSSAHQIAKSEQIAKYLRKVLATAKLDAAASERAVTALVPLIKRMVVWNEPQPAAPAVAADSAHRPGATRDEAAVAPVAAEPLAAARAAAEAPPLAPFDPFAFSAVVALTKTGREGLMKKLAAIEHVAHLRQLAEAQHLAVDTGAAKSADDWRRAIVDAAAQRIANRRAAAS